VCGEKKKENEVRYDSQVLTRLDLNPLEGLAGDSLLHQLSEGHSKRDTSLRGQPQLQQRHFEVFVCEKLFFKKVEQEKGERKGEKERRGKLEGQTNGKRMEHPLAGFVPLCLGGRAPLCQWTGW